MISIKGSIHEMDEIKKEIDRNTKRNGELRKHYKKLESEVLKYLEENDEIGVKYKNIAVIVENKPKREIKKAKEAEKDVMQILEDYGVDSADVSKVLKKITEAKKGEEIDNKKIKIKSLDDVKSRKKKE